MNAVSAPTQDPSVRSSWLVPGAAVAAVGGPLLLAATNALVAFTPGYADVDDSAELLAVVRDQTTLVEVGALVALLTAALLVPGVWAVAARLAPRTPRLAAVGGWMMATGYLMSVALPVESLVAVSVAAAGGDAAAYTDGVDQHMSVVAIAMYATFGIGALAGGLVLGIAMLRQRDLVPLWAGCALVASEPVRVAGLLLGVAVGPPVASLLIAAAFLAVVRAVR